MLLFKSFHQNNWILIYLDNNQYVYLILKLLTISKSSTILRCFNRSNSYNEYRFSLLPMQIIQYGNFSTMYSLKKFNSFCEKKATAIISVLFNEIRNSYWFFELRQAF